MNINIKRNKLAVRLKECLALRDMKPAQLSHIATTKYNETIHPSLISMILKGDRTLTDDKSKIVTKILDIDAGYLLGVDDFKSPSYQDFLNTSEYKTKREHDLSQMNEYMRYLDIVLGSYVIVDGDSEYYFITILKGKMKGKSARIPIDEMKKFNADIDSFITKKLDVLLMQFDNSNEL